MAGGSDMAKWTPPIGPYLLNIFGLGLVIWYIGPWILSRRLTGSIYALVMYVLIFVAIHIFLKGSLGEMYYHEQSRWRMGVDEVLGRLYAAMRARGVQVVAERRDKRLWLPLPPLSVVVVPGWWWTKVYAGPWTEENEARLEGLEAFVERAMG